MDYTRARTDGVVRSARQNPIPLALIGVGAAWLLTERSHRSRSRPPAGGDVPNYSSASQQPWYEDERDTGLMAMIRDHPVQAAFAGVGLSWLALASGQRPEDARGYGRMPAWRDRTGQWSNRSSESQSDDSGTDVSVTGAANEIASRTKEYAVETADSMKRMARRRQNQLQRMVQENPLFVGAGALMLGVAFGLAVPETEVENEWMGDARDTMVDRARDMARDAANQVPEVARSVADAAQNVAGKTQP